MPTTTKRLPHAPERRKRRGELTESGPTLIATRATPASESEDQPRRADPIMEALGTAVETMTSAMMKAITTGQLKNMKEVATSLTKARAQMLAENDDAALDHQFMLLVRVLQDRGHLKAVAVVFQVATAVQERDAKTLDRMAAAGVGVKRARGRRPKDASVTFSVLVRYVTETRREFAPLDDLAIATALVWSWVQALGESPRRAELLGDEAKLRALIDDDAEKFVRAVHRALGYPRSDNLTNATSKRRSRRFSRPQRP